LRPFRDHGHPAATLEQNIDEAAEVFSDLAALGINFDRITDELTREGVEAFAKSFRQLLQVIEDRRNQAIAAVPEVGSRLRVVSAIADGRSTMKDWPALISNESGGKQ
jgi:hypothetical protein